MLSRSLLFSSISSKSPVIIYNRVPDDFQTEVVGEDGLLWGASIFAAGAKASAAAIKQQDFSGTKIGLRGELTFQPAEEGASKPRELEQFWSMPWDQEGIAEGRGGKEAGL